jgi:SAM-dependent methyltransferase
MDKASYPLAWERSYARGGAKWRGGAHLTEYLPQLDLSETVMEIGSGNGGTAERVARMMPLDSRLVCIDVSGAAFGLFTKKLRGDGRTFVAVADARSVPFRSGVFKAIIVRHVLTHAIRGDEVRVLSEVSRLLAPGGLALVEVFARGDMRHGKGREAEPDVFVHGDGLVWRFYTEAELRASLEKAGLRPVRMDAISKAAVFGGRRYARESLVAVAGRCEG